MADQEARFAIELGVDGAAQAQDLDGALSRLRDQMKGDQAAVNELQTALKRLQQAGNVNVETFRELRDQLAAKKASLGAAQESYVKLGGAFGQVTGGANEASGGVSGLLQSLQATGGPIGALAGRANQAVQAVGKAGLAGAFVLAAALAVVFAIAIGAAVVGVMSFALGAAGAARSARLLAEASTGSAAGAAALGAAVDVAAGKAALARTKLDEMALALARGKLGGAALSSALSAAAVAAATMGDQAGSAIQSLAVKAQEAGKFMASALDFKGTGVDLADVAGALAQQLGIGFTAAEQAIKAGRVSVEQGLAALDAAVAKKFGKIARAQLLDFNFQVSRAKENVSRIFAGVKIEGFLEGMSRVLGLLDQSTASGRALKTISETALNPLFEALGSKGGAASNFFRGMVIAALSLTIVILKVRNAFNEAFGGDATSGIDGVKIAIQAGIVAFYALIAVVGVISGLFYGLYAIFVKPFVALFEVIGQAGAAFDALVGWFSSAYDTIAGFDFASLGGDLIDGLIGGITSKIGSVVEAVRGLGQAALGALRSTWDSHSPSRAFGKVGITAPQGVVHGVELGTPDVEDAVGRMVSIPSEMEPSAAGSKASGGARGSAQGSSGNTYIFNISGVSKAEELKEPGFLQQLVDAVEGAATEGGIPVPT